MSFNTLLPLIKKTGSTLSPAEFHHTINVVFHDIEAAHYDAIHAQMWDSLQEQISLLVDDVLRKSDPSASLRLLDVGCGTGLSTELLLRTKLGDRITDITLVDTSPNMLREAEKKAGNWNRKFTLRNTDVTAMDEKFDVIIVCSVLHHIPDLQQFLSRIDAIQNPGGIFIHLQDPNGDSMNSPESVQRVASYEKNKKKPRLKKRLLAFVPKKLKNKVNRLLGRKVYTDIVNDKLIDKKAIRKRMTPEEIWSVTDIHVEDLPFSVGSGISMKFLKETLKNYTLVNTRSYGFFGFLKSELEPSFQEKEQALIDANRTDGRHVSAVWIKK